MVQASRTSEGLEQLCSTRISLLVYRPRARTYIRQASWVLRQKYPRTLREFLGTFALAYLFTDAFLVVLHMFLDHEKNLHYPLQWVVPRTAFSSSYRLLSTV